MIDYTSVFVQNKKGFDQGLKNYMLKIYNYMTLALSITAVTAYATIKFPPLTQLIFNVTPNGNLVDFTAFGTIVSFLPLAIGIYFFMGIGKMSLNKAQIVFWIYASAMGVSLSYLGLIYTMYSLIKTFFICASVFGAMSIYGYTTNKDLTSMGSFFTMGLIGLIIVSIVNLFLKSNAIEFAISFIGVAVFMGLTAWDTQKLKRLYYSSGLSGEIAQKVSIMGAFTLYLDFVNLFLYLIKFLGNRK